MSCSQNTVNIKPTKQICQEECSYHFDYNPNSSAIVTNMGDYLEIQVDGKNDVKFNTLDLTVSNVKIFQPSFHIFNGKQVAGELVIEHSNPIGNSVLVCVPIVVRDGTGNSNSFFSQIIPHANSEKNVKQNINVSKWSLNYVVPVAPFYFYVGSYPYTPCSGKANIIIFDSKKAATISSSDKKILKTLISPISYSKAQMIGGASENDVVILRNELGSLGPNSDKSDYFILNDCEAITGMDDDNKGKKKKPTASDGDRRGLPGFLIGLISILALLIIAYIIFLFCTSFDISMLTNRQSSPGAPITNPKIPSPKI